VFELFTSACEGIVEETPVGVAPVTDIGELDDQLNDTPAVGEVKDTKLVLCPEHIA
jgi:hypothetical protein